MSAPAQDPDWTDVVTGETGSWTCDATVPTCDAGRAYTCDGLYSTDRADWTDIIPGQTPD